MENSESKVKIEFQPFWIPKGAKPRNGYFIKLTAMYESLYSVGYRSAIVGGNLVIVHEERNIVRISNEYEMTKTVMQFVYNNISDEEIRFHVEEAIRNKGTRLFAPDQIRFMKELDFQEVRDTIDTAYLFFQNVWLVITDNKIEIKDYEELEGHIWETRIIRRDFQRLELEQFWESSFSQFLKLVSGQSGDRLDSLMTIVGYLIHRYKNPRNNRAIVLVDLLISNEPNGGTGKSLFMKALSKVVETVIQDGKNFRFSSTFAFQNVEATTKLLVFDDVTKGFDLEKLFSILSDGMDVEKKGKQRIRISSEDSPKILITSNYTLMGNSSSYRRRKYEFEFEGYFHEGHTPFDEFNHLFFEDWGQKEWLDFDNFMIFCLQLYLSVGLIMVPNINIEKNRIIEESGELFIDFMEGVKLNHKHNRDALYKQYVHLCKHEDSFSIIGEKRAFCKWLRTWCEWKQLRYEEERLKGIYYVVFWDGSSDISLPIGLS